ncbi:tRNA guanosine(34) transglycosylase Tgt [Candidatus Woesearchaeota archaeon]|nr:tRNA guanosine(34) transglycosylase Tgt [Candidatus Woesearchaeota archaeon]
MFEIKSKQGKARTGKLRVNNREVETPFFMPVATKGAAKFIDNLKLKEAGSNAIICNGFILSIKPGLKVLEKTGGIHSFINYNGIIFTDSGGFQMYSDKFLEKTTKEGIHFKDPFHGEKLLITPEKDMEIQQTVGSDVAMCLDDMPLYGSSKERIQESILKTIDWAKRCKEYHDGIKKGKNTKAKENNKQLLFGIIQGGIYPDLREFCARAIVSLNFDGYAFGGLAIGEPAEETFSAVSAAIKFVPEDKPRYLMGVGTPELILEAVSMGVDCFDSRYPTMTARNGTLFTNKGQINIDKKDFEFDVSPIDKECDCFTCKNFTRSYIHHLTRLKEPTGHILKTIHNVFWIQNFMKSIRESIKEGKFEEFKKEFLENLKKKT